MWVQFLGLEDALAKEMATHSSFLAWRIPWTEELGCYSPWGCKELDTTEQLSMHTHVHTGTLASGPAKRVQNQQEKGTFRTDFWTLWKKVRVG